MADWPGYAVPLPPILTPYSMVSTSSACLMILGAGGVGNAASSTWPVANKAYFYPFMTTAFAAVKRMFFWVGATSTGHIDVGIYDFAKNLISHAGTTTMSATTGTLQILDVTDFTLPPGRYLLAAACDTASGTAFRTASLADEVGLPSLPIYEQTGLTLANLPDPCNPVLSTDSTLFYPIFGLDLRGTL